MIAGPVAFISMDSSISEACYGVLVGVRKHGSVKRVVNSVFGVGNR